ncbi:PEP-CTERM sorting domain-containing protein [Desulfonatronum thioautotrophicum]|uniref:PEP-CTERM sorting domain-containing protein n=1 Tax=Desulfonatronum thioautotrophicum TaxID=617001 RepID=UPI0005EBD222|nr:PEP-CTERM sorting domain-containing protein [Desulfonatronum thioautotrophicum]
MRALNRTWPILALTFIWLFWIAGTSQATTIVYTFGDSSYVWPGWEGTADNPNLDVWGIPDITGGTATVTGGLLTEVRITFAEWHPEGDGPGTYDHLYPHLRPGDLFIDLGVDQQWNYVFSYWDYGDSDTGYEGVNEVRTDYGAAYGGNFEDGLHGRGYDLGATGLSITDEDGYYWSQETWFNSDYLGQNQFPPRYNHPVAFFSDGHDFTTGGFLLTGWGTTEITFSNLNIELNGQSFAIGWTQSCANDILYHVVPEPSTLLLLFMGLGGLVLVRMRFRSRNSG